MRKNYKYILLDVDGTLYPNSKYLKACHQHFVKNIIRYAAAKKLPKQHVSVLVREYAMRSKVTYTVRELSERYKLDRHAFLNYVYDVDPKKVGIRRDDRLVSLFKKIPKKVRIAVFTNSPNIWALRVLSDLGVMKYIERRRITTLESLDNGRLIKPSRQAFERVLKRLRAKPGEIIYLEDTMASVREGMRMGVDTIQICNDRNCRMEGHRRAISIYKALEMLTDK